MHFIRESTRQPGSFSATLFSRAAGSCPTKFSMRVVSKPAFLTSSDFMCQGTP
jgi:hypothetical protein